MSYPIQEEASALDPSRPLALHLNKEEDVSAQMYNTDPQTNKQQRFSFWRSLFPSILFLMVERFPSVGRHSPALCAQHLTILLLSWGKNHNIRLESSYFCTFLIFSDDSGVIYYLDVRMREGEQIKVTIAVLILDYNCPKYEKEQLM